MKKLFTLLLASLLLLGGLTGCASNNEQTAKFDKEADLVIIGAGGAGLAAAVEAADNGVKNIVVLEKMGVIGGTTFISQGMISGYDTHLQEEQGIKLTYEEMYANLMNNALHRLDPKLTSITVEKCGETVNWLMDRVKVPFTDKVLVGYGPLQMMHVIGSEEVVGGQALKTPFETALTEAGVETLLSTKATEILMNEDGSVKGVKATNADGDLTIGAKAVVIATGGYSNNPELTELLTPEMAGTFGIGHPACTGDGIIMASNVGAALTHTDHLMAVLKDYEIMAEHNGTSASASVSKFIAAPNLVLTGLDGKRFVDEKSGGYMTQELNSPIFDQMHKENADYVWAISDKATLEAMKVVRGKEMEFITADTTEDLANKMGVDAAALTETITNYNSYAANGVDPEFKRSAEVMAPLAAPYVAVKVVPCEIITYGGVARNEAAEVLRADGSSIPGLYVAGEAAANSAYMGFTVSNAFTWGRIAGASAAGYINK